MNTSPAAVYGSPEGENSVNPLVGQIGVDYVVTQLTQKKPNEAINEIQRQCAVLNKQCKPLLTMLDQMLVSRAAAYQHMVQSAKKVLLQRINKMSQEQLLKLLESSFSFIGLVALREVPVCVLSNLDCVPTTYLKQLSGDQEVFQDLPPNIQCQVWELDKNLIQLHSLPVLLQFVQDQTAVKYAIGMESYITESVFKQGPLRGFKRERAGERKNFRQDCNGLQTLVGMVGSSRSIYRSILELLMVQVRDGEGQGIGKVESGMLCSLRSQLLMALHDESITDICQQDPVHKLAWVLDACLREGKIDSKRMNELRSFFHTYEYPSDHHIPSWRGRGSDVMDNESLGGFSHSAGDEPWRPLLDAALVLRDPPVFYLILFQIVACLEDCVANFVLPSRNEDLQYLLRLAQLAVSVKWMMRQTKYYFPGEDVETISQLCPVLCEILVDSQLSQRQTAMGRYDERLLNQIKYSRGSRFLCQAFCLQRIAACDLWSAGAALQVFVALFQYQEEVQVEFGPFFSSLARLTSALVQKGLVQPSATDAFWAVAFEELLIKGVCVSPWVHEAVLKMLYLCWQQTDGIALCEYLKKMIYNGWQTITEFEQFLASFSGRQAWPSSVYGKGTQPALKPKHMILNYYRLFVKKVDVLDEQKCPQVYDFVKARQGTQN